MRSLSRETLLAFWYVILLVAVTAVSMLSATPFPQDDHFFYQQFIETLAGGKLDLSIPGFHGMNILAVPWYLVTKSPIAQIQFQMLSGVLLPFFAFLAGWKLFRSLWHGVVLATIIALMPFHSFSSLRGWMVATYNCLVFLTIYGAAIRARWTWIPWGFSIISLPFSVALLPLMLYFTPPSDKPVWWRYRIVGYGLLIPIIYVLIQYAQIGQVNVGVHKEMNHSSVWSGPERIVLNAAHTLQIVFSVHNYYYVEPAKTGHGNMMHTTPILVFLGLFALLSPKKFFRDRGLPLVLLLGACTGIGLNIMLDHMDDFYMQTGLYFVIFAALPVLKKYPLWIPFTLATLHFQWLYFYLQHGAVFQLGPLFFLVPAVADIAFLLWCLLHIPDVRRILREAYGK
ncbi:hypothetical protein COU78_01005 [Candidatus Peregrinibacteria bacterium CG10_big_fil_rev_8_21_14_0_10_49_24]|nr:MAG: hypothetical protein COV83_01255 [Candidatus Peregrinibacteria bacterium CG11_big_fil_rev_8_21_14_0_20_49_14]PIR51527.1 MAG: hypothetical protein COU78_01005 [Candidatus Peregrinibacteria bacterium CG10_big_fil_rev_8_21_14_0_10_49_24]PJA67830.1 MAG: hypothetical protein CO157_02335 [Candidatus Peregrinibacteria bacterium CG_4_9_14_3_um_filter_49_12]